MSDRSGRYLRFIGGEPTRNLPKTIHPALQLDLRAALVTAKQENRQAEFRNIRIRLNEEELVVNLVVRPVILPNTTNRYFLIVFNDEHDLHREDGTKSVSEALVGDSALEAVIRRLEEELQDMRDRLRMTLEHSEISTEELKASNEELQAINEELRSATEELEELQSVNEELTTVNNELKEKVFEISTVNLDLQNLMHSTDIGTIFLDRSLSIKRYTRKVEQFYNIIDADIGRPLEHLTHKFNYTSLPDDCAEVFKSLRVIERELTIRSSQCVFLARISPYRTLDERIDGVVISFIEITELKRTTDSLREQEFLLRMAQEAAKAGVWAIDLENGDAWWSDEYVRLLEKDPGSIEMSTENWLAELHPNDRVKVEAGLKKAMELGTKYIYELKLESPHGERWILEVGRAFQDAKSGKSKIAGISLDITERILAQREQVQLLKKHAIDELALREGERLKDELLATLAHELRNPLAPIRTGIEVLKTSISEPLRAEKIINMIERQTNQMVFLIDDLLDVSRITKGMLKMRRSIVDFEKIMESAIETAQPMISQFGHRLETSFPEEPVQINGDPTRLIQAFSNLLNNGSRYTPDGGRISFTTRLEDKWIVTEVIDNGIGIEPSKLESIFEMFTQIRKKDELSMGLGIGLTLVRLLVMKHGGTVHAESDGTGKGSKFIVRLPIYIEADEDTESIALEIVPEVIPMPTTGFVKSILVVDDGISAADILAMFFRAEGYEVHTAYDGRRAIEVAERVRPDVIFLDIGMPVMDGHEAARQIRQQPWGKEIILIALTGWGQDSDRLKTENAGFDHHLVKPVDPNTLRTFVKNLSRH